ncbi:AbrB/MazE/SpoVT family DNA-binding domain-containing protein [Parvularcula maris]|uniref:AbrB/MazE/SpoVT family DNA-binding domain-containing protein n=1 Tax=Parvularcula maris TaxID=2965077 RepID=UPI00351A1D7D
MCSEVRLEPSHLRSYLCLTQSKEAPLSSATLTAKCQLTLPKDVREELKLGPGDRVTFVRREDGGYLLVPARRSISELRGMVRPQRKGLSLADMDAAIATAASEQ